MKVLVIGSTVVDVILNISKIPTIGEDENIISQQFSVGGCAYNVFSTLRYLHINCDLFSPIGKGIYGDYIKNHFQKNNIPVFLKSNGMNGCCYCLVDAKGERTFMALHGTEYIFKKEWFHLLKNEKYDAIYVCGLELEETTGCHIIEFLKSRQEPIYFSPSSRLCHINKNLMKEIFDLNPVVHLSKSEILQYMQFHDIQKAARILYQKTKNIVIITLAEEGSYFYDGKDHYIPAFKSKVVDTIGAGDCHIGAYIGYTLKGLDHEKALLKANYLSSLVVEKKGAGLK